MDQGPLSVSINVMLLLSADLCWDHKCWSCHMQPHCRPLRHPKYPKSKTLVTHVLHDLTSTSESKDRSCIQISGLPGMKLWHHTSHFRRNHGKLRVWPRDAKGLCYTCRGSLRCNPSLLGSPSLGKRFACTGVLPCCLVLSECRPHTQVRAS